MAITGITYKPPYAALVDATVTPISGTGFVAGTYEFAIYVANTGVNVPGACESPPLYRTGVVLNGSQGVRVDVVYDESHTDEVLFYVMVRRNTSGAGTGTWYYLRTTGSSFVGTRYPTATWDYSAYSYYGLYPASTYPNEFPYVSNQYGSGVIEIGDMGSPSTTVFLKTIIDDMYDNGYLTNEYSYYNKYNFFAGCWSLKTVTGAQGMINMTGFSLWLYSYSLYDPNFKLFSTSGVYPTKLSAFKYSGAGQYMVLYGADLIGISIGGDVGAMGSYVGSLQMNVDDNTRLRGCIVMSTYPPLKQPYTYEDCNVYAGTFVLCQLNNSLYTSGFVVWGYIRVYANTYETKIRDCKIKVPGGIYNAAQLVTSSNPTEILQRYCDCEFITYTSTTDFTVLYNRDYPYYIYWTRNVADSFFQSMLIEHSINLIIIDSSGEIEGAIFNIYDKDNTLVATGTSDIDGIVTEMIITCKNIKLNQDAPTGTTSSLEGDYHTIDRRYPFTIQISKSGYVTLSMVYETLESKINTKLTLVKTKPSITGIVITDCTAVGGSDGSLEITADSYYDVEYSINGTDYQASNTFSGLPAGTYTVYVKDSNGEVVTMEDNEITEPVLIPTPVVDITALVETIEISGIVETEEVMATVEEKDITGTVEPQELSASVEIVEISGEVQ